HEVRRGGDVRRGAAQYLALGGAGRDQFVGAEAAPVEPVGRVGVGSAGAGRQDLVPGVVPLAPERGPPGVVEGDQVVVVAGAQPGTERGRAGVAVAGRVVAAVLVVDVPQGERGVVGVALGEGGGDPQGGPPVRGVAGAERLPAARPQPAA